MWLGGHVRDKTLLKTKKEALNFYLYNADIMLSIKKCEVEIDFLYKRKDNNKFELPDR